MIKFADMRPSWETEKRTWTRDDLLALGCSKQLVQWLNPNPETNALMIDPEEWFWRDKEWFKGTSNEIVAELQAVSGGHFGDMKLQEQCAFLGIPLSLIGGKMVKDLRGKWEGLTGPVSAEEFVLEHFKNMGAQGLACEGNAQSAWQMAMHSRFQQRTGLMPGFERVNGKLVPETPSDESALLYIDALRDVRVDIEGEYKSRQRYYDKLWRVSFEDMRTFADIVGWELLEKIAYMFRRHGVGGGWPDITMRLNGNVRFVEVKVKDRLRGSQARWVRDIAKPLGLDVSVVQLEAV